MKLFYYLYGVISMLFIFMLLFDLYGPIYIDDYYMDILHIKYHDEWWYTNVGISTLVLMFSIIFLCLPDKKNNYTVHLIHEHENFEDDEEDESNEKETK